MTQPRLALGMMSGTSCDGIDAAVVSIAGRGTAMRTSLLSHVHVPFSPAFRKRLQAVMAPAHTTVDEMLALSAAIGEAHIKPARLAVAKAGLQSAAALSVAGVHGQTICHRPPRRPGRTGASLQLGQFAPLAAALGIPVVSDFRAADLAAGGQGAPLVPWTDVVLAGDRRRVRVVVNLGGICNATFLPAGRRLSDVRAGDLGPCNLLLDGLIAARTGGKTLYDKGGALAAGGRVNAALAKSISQLIARALPRGGGAKSLGREEFGPAFLKAVLKHAKHESTADLLATCAALIAERLAACTRPFVAGATGPLDVLLAGGGTHNAALRAAIQHALPGAHVANIETFIGIPEQAKEAVSFALLALAHVDGVPANLPAVTGAARPVVLGVRTAAQA